MSASRLLAALRRSWYLVLAGLVLGGLLGGAAWAALPHSYQASSVVLVSTPSLNPSTNGNDYVETRMATYGELITSRPVLAAAERSARLPAGSLTPRQVTAEVPPSTFLIHLTATASDPRAAADIANAVTSAFVTLAPGLDNAKRSVIAVALIERALPQDSTTTLSPLIPLLAGLVLGLTAGVLLALVRAARPARVRTVDEAVRATGSAALAVVSWSGGAGGLTVGPQGPRARRASRSRAEPFPALFSRLGLDTVQEGKADGPRVVTVVSTVHQQEAAVVASGLASTCQANGQECLVLAIDDETHALLHDVVAVDRSGAPSGPAKIDLARRAGAVLTEAELRIALEVASPVPDLVIVPAPPVDLDPGTRTAVRSAAQVLLALPLGSGRPRAASRAARAVEESGRELAGTVLLVEERRGRGRDLTVQSWQ